MILVTVIDCGGMDILRLIKMVIMFLKIVFLVAPIILMVMISIDFFKNVSSGKDEEIKKNISIAIKRVIACLLLFLVPTFFNIITNMIGTDYSKCFELAKNVELLSNKPVVDSGNNNSDKDSNNNLGSNDSNNETENSNGGEIITTTKSINKNTTTTSKSTSKMTTKTTTKTTTTTKAITTIKQSTNRKNIFVGDSRCVGIQDSIASSEKNKSKWICKVSQGYNWLKSTAINTLNTMIEPNEYYNIYINLGVNDMYNISSYINYFNAMKKNSKYKNCNIIIVSVNPVDDNKAKSYGYLVANSDVINFNSKMKNGLDNGISYCDTYSKVKSNFQTTDGLHYNNSTSKNIYNHIINCK